MKKIKLNTKENRYFVMMVDIIIIIGVLVGFVMLKRDWDWLESIFFLSYKLPITALLFFILSSLFEVYDSQYMGKTRKIIPRISLLGIVLMFLFYFTPFLNPGIASTKYQVLLVVTLPSILLSLWRGIYAQWFFHTLNLNKLLLIYDSNDNGYAYSLEEIYSKIKGEEESLNYKVGHTIDLAKVAFSDLKKLEPYLKPGGYTSVVLAVKTATKYPKDVEQFLIKALRKRVGVVPFEAFYEEHYEAIALRLLTNNFYNYFPINRNNKNYIYLLFSRVLDLSFGIVFTFFTLLCIPFVWFFNLFLNKGPLFYSQPRVGLDGKEFGILKFRTMVVEAEKQGAMMSKKGDARVTAFGKILRDFRIDELPQSISLFTGDMGLIGPRPERKIFTDQLNEKYPFYDTRHLIKPGITGWAQVKYKYGENLDDSLNKLEYDLYYIKNRSVFLDIRIIVKTIKTVLNKVHS